jgi:hypothetical protein
MYIWRMWMVISELTRLCVEEGRWEGRREGRQYQLEFVTNE